MKTLGKKIRLLRHQKGWSQEDVAKRLDISIPAFSKIETGITDINLSRLEQISNLFEMTVVQLLTFNEAEQDQKFQNELEMVNKKLMDTFDYPYLQMSGSLISTSAPQCVKGINEFEGLISIETWKKVIEPLAKKHGLIEGTTFKNLPFNKLHWGCRHEFTPTMVKTGDPELLK